MASPVVKQLCILRVTEVVETHRAVQVRVKGAYNVARRDRDPLFRFIREDILLQDRMHRLPSTEEHGELNPRLAAGLLLSALFFQQKRCGNPASLRVPNDAVQVFLLDRVEQLLEDRLDVVVDWDPTLLHRVAKRLLGSFPVWEMP